MKAGLLEWMFIVFQILLPIESVLVNAVVFTDLQWVTFHLSV
jgi:hypothetical protein